MRRSRTWRSAVTVTVLGVTLAFAAACGGKKPAAAPVWHASGSASGGASSSGSSVAPSPSTSVPTGKPVHVRLLEGDGSTWGVGMPIIAYLSAKITDAKAFAAATTVTVNGSPVQGAWYFEKSAIYSGYPLEAHYRTQDYWPAHSKIHLGLPVKGVSAGTGLVFDDSLTLDMSIGAANISQVNGKTERMTVTSDGKQKFSFPVSLGKAGTPTFDGTKVV